jgi:PTH2 family peptidyl-tRNA hydrolase
MSPGKAAAQAGHAYLEAYFRALELSPALAAAYRADPPGTKVVLAARDEPALLRLEAAARAAGVAAALITDHGHVLPPHFDGGPVVTALGLGPATREQIDPIIHSLKLVR